MSASVASKFAGVVQLIHDPTIADASLRELGKWFIAFSEQQANKRHRN
jgi:hypothetical protein